MFVWLYHCSTRLSFRPPCFLFIQLLRHLLALFRADDDDDNDDRSFISGSIAVATVATREVALFIVLRGGFLSDRRDPVDET